MIKQLLKQLKFEKKGNTLIQLPMAIAIIGGLALTTIHAMDVLVKTRDVRRTADAYQITLALTIYYDDHSTYPVYTSQNPEQSWQLLAQNLEPAYIQELPDDPQSNNYSYRYWSDGRTAKIFYFSETENKRY